MKMLVALFPLVDGKRSNRSGNEQNQIQNWPSINGKYENTLYTCIYQKHKVPVYTVEIGLNYQRNQIKVQNGVFCHSFKQSFCHVHAPWIKIVPVLSHSLMNTLFVKGEKKIFQSAKPVKTINAFICPGQHLIIPRPGEPGHGQGGVWISDRCRKTMVWHFFWGGGCYRSILQLSLSSVVVARVTVVMGWPMP